MNYEQSLEYLYGLIGSRTASPAQYTPLKLERMRRLCALVGDPQRRLRTVLVAGTKGKGSTSAMLASIAQAAGLRVGLYTKPHLEEFRERMRVDGELIPPATLAGLVEEVRAAVALGEGGPGWPPTYFEVSAALALLHFARSEVDLAVVEVGIGGRLDATNVADPILSVITTVGYDHTDLLGPTLRQIAMEDVGIIRPGGTVVTVPQLAVPAEVIESASEALGATLIRVGRDVRYRTLRSSLAGTHITVTGRRGRYRDLTVPLLGRHQALNAAAAVAAAEALDRVGARVTEETIRAGLAGLSWPARIELVRRNPMVIVDVAHNPVSFRALRAVLDETFSGRRLVLVMGVIGTKDLAGIVRTIAPRAAVLVATRAHDDRALPAGEVAAAFRGQVPELHVIEEPADAFDFALGLAGGEDVVCAAGSFHVAGPVRAHLRFLQGSAEAGPGGRATLQPAGFSPGDAGLLPAVPAVWRE